jgi:hypothetical protein
MKKARVRVLERELKRSGLPPDPLKILGRIFRYEYILDDEDIPTKKIMWGLVTGIQFMPGTGELRLAIQPQLVEFGLCAPNSGDIQYEISSIVREPHVRQGDWHLFGKVTYDGRKEHVDPVVGSIVDYTRLRSHPTLVLL